MYNLRGVGKKIQIAPKNNKQRMYIDLMTTEKPYVVVATGSAGTGKTLLATHVGVTKLMRDEINRLVITRPAVSVDEQHGFLPGTLEQKMEPWTRPILDVLGMHFPTSKIDMMLKEKIIEICPLAYMRGRTFDNSWIVCDEAQNTTINQMLMVLTRIGKDSKIVITGDPKQYDRGFHENGLSDLLKRMNRDSDENIGIVEFSDEDVERHPVIPVILSLYNDPSI